MTFCTEVHQQKRIIKIKSKRKEKYKKENIKITSTFQIKSRENKERLTWAE